MTEEKAKKSVPASQKVKVKNVSKRTLHLSTGVIDESKSGECTMAEYRQFTKYLELVK